jgi:hypothetical protein
MEENGRGLATCRSIGCGGWGRAGARAWEKLSERVVLGDKASGAGVFFILGEGVIHQCVLEIIVIVEDLDVFQYFDQGTQAGDPGLEDVPVLVVGLELGPVHIRAAKIGLCFTVMAWTSVAWKCCCTIS